MRNVRFVCICILLWAVALLGVRKYVCLGWVIPIQVASHSMVPTLVGPHFHSVCAGCEQPLRTDANGDTAKITCLNCGHTQSTESATRKTGTRVLIDRRALRKHGIQRFDIVALRAKEQTGRTQLRTKRVVGLPGEQISVRTGDLYADGSLLQKDAQQFADVAILVHADRHRRPRVAPRWRSSTEDSAWQTESASYEWYRPHDLPAKGRPDWLAYDHHLSPNVTTPPASENWVYDDYEFNQSASRRLHRVRDLAVSARLQWNGAGTICVRCPSPLGTCTARLAVDASGRLTAVELWVDDILVAQANDLQTLPALPQPVWVWIGYWDRQWVCRWDDVELLRHRFSSLATALEGSPSNFGWAVMGLEQLTVADLRVWRDIYYFPLQDALAPLGDPAQNVPLGRAPAGHYLLLGDNVPYSQDARHGEQFGIVAAEDLLGIVSRVQ